jgi:hypothetical protein
MSHWQEQNPHVDLHLIWYQKSLWRKPFFIRQKDGKIRNRIRIMMKKCFDHNVRLHLVETEQELINVLKRMDRGDYKRGKPYIIRTKEPSLLARWFRQFPRMSSEMAMDLDYNLNDHYFHSFGMLFENGRLKISVEDIISDTIGRKKNEEPKKLATDLIRWLETGEEP